MSHRHRARVDLRLLLSALALIAAGALSRSAHAVYFRSFPAEDYAFAPNIHATLSGQDDAISEVLTLPFAFPFQDEVFTQLRIHTNGFVTLGAAGPNCGVCAGPQSFLSTGQPAAPDYTIAPWWADWDPSADGEIYYGAVDGKFVVEWWNVRAWNAAPGQAYTFELQLSPDGRFDFVYGTVSTGLTTRDFGRSGSSGYQGRSAAGFAFSQMFGDGTNGTLWNGEAISFTHDTNATDLTSRR